MGAASRWKASSHSNISRKKRYNTKETKGRNEQDHSHSMIPSKMFQNNVKKTLKKRASPSMVVKCRPKSRCIVLVSLISKEQTIIKQHILEAQTHRSRARAFSDRKSNRIRAPRISPNLMPADVPEQSRRYPDPDRGAFKNYQTRFQYD